MAISEKPTGQYVSVGKRLKTAEFYFQNLLKSEPKKSVLWGFDKVKEFVEKYAGCQLSPDLMRIFDPRSFFWTSSGGEKELGNSTESLPVLLLGKHPKTSPEMTTDVNDALMTIEIARKTGNLNPVPTKYVPLFLRIAGIDKKQGKIFTMMYKSGPDKYDLMEINVSLASNEVLRSSPLINPQRMLVQFPSRDDRPYDTAGYVTERMVKNVKKLENEKGDSKSMNPLMEGIIFSRMFDEFYLGNHLTYVDLKRQQEYMRQSGYYIKQNEGLLTAGLHHDPTSKRVARSWEISVPEFLLKA